MINEDVCSALYVLRHCKIDVSTFKISKVDDQKECRHKSHTELNT